MDYEARTAERFVSFYEPAYAQAFQMASEGQTTRYEADLTAQHQATILAQRVMSQTDMYYLATEIYGMKTAVSAKAGMKGRKIWHPPIHGRVCDELEKPDDSIIHVSRNTLKSTLAKVWGVQQLLIDPAGVRIGMWSKSTGKVRSELRSLQGMLQNKRLLGLFPERLIANPKKWEVNNQDALTVTRNVPDEDGNERLIPMDEAQIEVWGLESTVVGRHYTHHYYDDIIDRGNTNSANAIEKTHEQWAAIQAMKSPETIEKVVGTPWHQLDLYATIVKEEMIADPLIIPGVSSDWTINYPYFTMEWLKKQEIKMGGPGSYLFSCQYMLDTMPKGSKMFTLPVPYWSADSFPAEPVYYMAVDPSTGKSERHDKTGICVGAVERSAPTDLFVVEADSYTWKPEVLAREVVKRIAQYHPAAVGIEYGLQEAVRPLIDYEISAMRKKGVMFRTPVWVEIKTGGGREALSKPDKIDRTLGAMVRNQRMFFRPSMEKVFRQMALFNPNVQKNEDDILDACSMLVQTVPSFHQSNWMGVTRKAVVGSLALFNKKKTKSRDVRDGLFVA